MNPSRQGQKVPLLMALALALLFGFRSRKELQLEREARDVRVCANIS